MWITMWLLSLALVFECSIVASAQSASAPPGSRKDPRTKMSSRVIAGTVVKGEIDRRTFLSALEALSRKPQRIVIVDAATMPRAFAEQMRDVDGFVLAGDRAIYLLRQSATLQAAEYSGGSHILMLSSVIWHELAHAEGLDEPAARRREEELWRGFVMTGRVGSSVGLSVLAQLRERR